LARCGASGVPDEDFGHQRSLVLVKPALPDSLPRRSTRTVHAGRSRPPKWVRDRPVERSSNRTPVRAVPVSGLLAGHGARFALRSLVNASHGTPSSETLCSRRRPGHPEDPADSEAARGSGSAPIARCARCRRGRDAPAQRRCAAGRASRGTARPHRSVAGGFPRRSPGLSRWLSLPSPRSNDGGRMPAGKGRMSCRRIRWACTRQHRPVPATITELPGQVR